MENEKQINLSNFENCKDIKEKDVLEFLQTQDYKISNFKCKDVQEDDLTEYNTSHRFYFYNYDDLDYTTYNYRLVLLASPEDWENTNLFTNPNKNFLGTKCDNNPFVRYIYFTISEFKVYIVLKDIRYPKYLTTQLEYDLSKEWVQFLAEHKKGYKQNLVALCAARKQTVIDNACKATDYHTAKQKEIDTYLIKAVEAAENEFEQLSEMEKWAEEATTID